MSIEGEPKKEACRDAIMSEDYADILVDYIFDLSTLEDRVDIICNQIISNQFAVLHTLNSSNISLNLVRDGYYRAVPKLYGLMDTSNIEETGVQRIRRLPYLDLLGDGTIIGIIDTGIDYTNPLFLNADNTSRIAYLWDQTVTEGPLSKSIAYGREYTRKELNEALKAENPLDVVPENDSDGHGTFLAAVAAGNIDIENDFSGIAPNATLIVVKLKPAKAYLREFFQIQEGAVAYQENDIMTAINYLIVKAEELEHPLSILIGLGTSQGDHDGHTVLSSYLNTVSNLTGICVSVAAGNEGNAGHHYEGEIQFNTSEDVEIKVGENDKGMSLELWSLSPSVFSVGIVSPSGEVAEKVPARQDTSVPVSFVLEPTKVQVTYGIADMSSGNELILMQFTDLVPGIWKIRVYNEFDIGTNYNIWLPITNFVSSDTYFLRPNPYVTLVETGTAAQPISTATYNHKNNSIYIRSSRGYTLSGRVKPDLVAPGVNIYGPSGKNQFSTRSGSSIAAAHTAGIASLLLQWGIAEGHRTSLNTAEIKALLIKGAIRTNRTYPNQEWGFGAINAYNAFESLRNRS